MKKKKNKVVEQMIRFQTPMFTIRVWRDCTKTLYPNNDLVKAIEQFAYQTTGKLELAENMAKFVGVAAVEVLDISGNGYVVYPDWK